MKELASALAKAQAMMKPALKDSTNPHFKSKYADLTSIWEACRDALTKNGLSVAQVTEFDGDLCWIKTILLHSSGEVLEGRYPLRPVQNTPQGMGSAISYARRYALAAMVGVVADDDDGAAASSGNYTEERQPAHPVGSAQPTSMVGRKNEAEGVKKAREWVNAEALPAVAACKTAEALNVWTAENGKIIERVKVLVPDDAAALDHRIKLKAESFNVRAAAE